MKEKLRFSAQKNSIYVISHGHAWYGLAETAFFNWCKKKKNATKNFIKDRIIRFNKTFCDVVGVITFDLKSQNTKVMSMSL